MWIWHLVTPYCNEVEQVWQASVKEAWITHISMEAQHCCLTWINVGFEMSSNPQYKTQFPQQGLGNLITRTSLLHLEQLLTSFRVREMTNIFWWYRQHHVMGSAPSISTLLFQTGITVASLSSYPMTYSFTDYRHKARSWLQKDSRFN